MKTAERTPGPFDAPVYAGDFPDPSIILIDGTYWAYSTGSAGRNLQVMSSADLHQWSHPVDPLPKLPSWASPGLTWAPRVLVIGSAFLLYYTVRDPSRGQQSISVATSTTPGGPFADPSPGPMICQSANGGSIDPDPHVDPDSGLLYLLWKSDDNSLGVGDPSHLWGQQLSGDGMSPAPGTSPSLLLTQSAPWQAPTIEGPNLTGSGGRWYLFYAANSYASASSGIGYATSSSLLGPFDDSSRSGPWLATRGNARGPQGPCVFRDASGARRMAFAAWHGRAGYANGGVRSLWIGTLAFDDQGRPVLD